MPLPLDPFLQQIKQIKIIAYKQTYYVLGLRETEGILTCCVR